jgi:hypothetical protein
MTNLGAQIPPLLKRPPRAQAHFAMTKGEEVLLHIVGEGPAGTAAVQK